MRILYLLLFLVAGSLLSAQSTTDELSVSVYFATASSDLDTDARQIVTDFRKQLSAYAEYDLRLEAFTDERGDTDYNEKLAESRAASVRNLLAEDGMTTSGWEVVTWGERRARRGTTDEDELRVDRRVDLVATVRPWTDMEEVLTSLRKDQVQTFTADPAEDVTVRGDRGGRFLIPAGSLVDADGNPATGPITVSLTEAYTFDDILIAGLTTHSGERLLETGGMFNLVATDEDGNPLSLAEGKSIPASIPTDDFNPEMRIFAGVEHAEGEGPDWELTSGGVTSTPTGLLAGLPGAPFPQEWEVDLEKQIEQWLLRNPEPGETGLRKINTTGRKPMFPDTASMNYSRVSWEKIFMSKAEVKVLTQKKRQDAAAYYHKNFEKWERRKARREEALAFNKIRTEEIIEEKEAWQQKFDAFKEEQIAKNGEMNENLRARFNERLAEWRAKRQTQLENALTDNTANARQGDLDRYFLTVSKTGWANCDVFRGEEQLVKASAKIPDGHAKATVLMLPEGIRSVLRYKQNSKERWTCAGVPEGTGYLLIAYQLNDGQIEYTERHVQAADRKPVDLNFEPVSVQELKLKLKSVRAAK